MNQALVQDVVAEVMRRLGPRENGASSTVRAGEDAPANEPKFKEGVEHPHRIADPVGKYGIFDKVDDCVAAATESQKKLAKQKYAGAFHVQVGAYTSESEAESRLGVVQQRASDLLDGHLPFTTSFTKEGAEWYRARFAGFSRGDAQSVCDALKKMSVDCVVMKAE